MNTNHLPDTFINKEHFINKITKIRELIQSIKPTIDELESLGFEINFVVKNNLIDDSLTK